MRKKRRFKMDFRHPTGRDIKCSIQEADQILSSKTHLTDENWRQGKIDLGPKITLGQLMTILALKGPKSRFICFQKHFSQTSKTTIIPHPKKLRIISLKKLKLNILKLSEKFNNPKSSNHSSNSGTNKNKVQVS